MSRNGTLLSLGVVVVLVGVASLFATGAIGRTPPVPRPTTPPTLNLSGTWGGLNTAGPLNSFMTLTLTQTGKALDGTVAMQSPPENVHISGGVSGNAVSFGAAGVISFTGTLSGSTLSGSYTSIANGKASSGSWTATLDA